MKKPKHGPRKKLPMRVCACNLVLDPEKMKRGEIANKSGICKSPFQPRNPQHTMIRKHKNRLTQKNFRDKIKREAEQGTTQPAA